MSRYRPPPPKSSHYITPEGAERMKDEVRVLWQEREVVTKEVQAAAALGDRSENAEYIYGKKRLREIDSRLRHLGNRLDKVDVVHGKPSNREQVFFGAWVHLIDEDDQDLVIRIVGPDEFDMGSEFISMDSPMGKALLKKHQGDEVTVSRPKGDTVFYIEAVSYEGPDQFTVSDS